DSALGIGEWAIPLTKFSVWEKTAFTLQIGRDKALYVKFSDGVTSSLVFPNGDHSIEVHYPSLKVNLSYIGQVAEPSGSWNNISRNVFNSKDSVRAAGNFDPDGGIMLEVSSSSVDGLFRLDCSPTLPEGINSSSDR